MKAYLIQIDARDSAGDPLSMRFASHDDAGLCHYDGETWWPAIAQLPSISYDFFDGGFRGDIGNPSGSFSLSMQAYPDMASAIWSDAAFSLYQMDFDDSTIANLVTLFAGRIRSQPRFSGGRAEVEFESDDRWLDEVLLDTYAGTGGVEGPDELEGAVKPLLLGAPRFAPGVLIDAVDNVYQLSAYGAIQGVDAVYDRLSSLGASTGDHASLAALLAADIANGSWATCLALGLVRLGAPPDGQVCFHVRADAVGGWSRLPGALVDRIAGIASGSASSASLLAINGTRPYNLSVAIADQITPRELIQSIAASIKAVAGVNWSGELFLAPIAITAAVKTLKSDGMTLPPIAEVTQLPVDPPFWRLATEAEKTWVVHGAADIAYQFNFRGAYSEERVYRLDDVVSVGDGSTWRFIGDDPVAGSVPSDGNPDWERRSAATVVDFANVTGTDALLADISEALELAAARGKVWTTVTIPSVAQSNVGDTWIAPDGVFYDRVPAGGILLDGKIVVLGGYRPFIAWTPSVNQPLRDTIAATTSAQATADSALLALSYLDDDGILTVDEKVRRLIPEDAVLEQSYATITATATGLSVSTAGITAARAAWILLRDAISPAWNDTTQNSVVVRNSLDATLLAYRDEFDALRAAIETKIEDLTSDAQSTADDAYAAAGQANTILANIANDDLLTPDEKPDVVLNRDVIVGEQAGIEASADIYGITTEKTAYAASITALTVYLATLTTPVLWSSLAGNTTIVGATFRSKFAGVYAARQVLLNKIAAVAAVKIESIGDDGILSRNEKLQLVREVAAILANHAALDAKATTLGTVDTEQTNAQASIDALDAYLTGLSPAWDDSSQDTAIVRAIFNTKFDDVADDVAALQAAIQGRKGNFIDILFTGPGPEPATPFGTSPAGWTNQPMEGGYYSRAERRAEDGAIVTTWSVPVKLGTFRNRGAWNGSDTYYRDDTVQYSGGTYAASTETTGSAPSGTDQDNANWYVIAAPGSAGTPATPPSAFSDTINLTTQTGPVNLRTLADAAGYTGMSDATITFNVPTGVTITGGAGGLNGITTGTWPSGYTINLDLSVTGKVFGGGGKGGNGESGDNGGSNGGAGGDAFNALEDIDIVVNSGGEIKGGGGGGGGGKGTSLYVAEEPIFYGGGGGGGGAPNGAGGIRGNSDGGTQASNGSSGTTGGGGAGGALGSASYSSAGGNGGGFAAAGANVASGTNGGAAGYAIRKNGKTVNVTNNGTITGAQG